MAEEELELDVNNSKKKSPILLIVIILLVLNLAGVGAWIFLSKDESTSSDSAAKEETLKGPLKYLTMVPEFIVNFGPTSKVRYLQVDLQIATRDEKVLAIVGTYRPVIRNDILVVLSGVSFDDLKDRRGKEALQKKLLDTINKVVVSVGNSASHGKEKDKKKDAHHASAEEHGTHDERVAGPIENIYFTSFIMQ